MPLPWPSAGDACHTTGSHLPLRRKRRSEDYNPAERLVGHPDRDDDRVSDRSWASIRVTPEAGNC